MLPKQSMRRGHPVLLLALCGCDPTSGLADTADAALPAVKRYFDGPGSRVADGPWNRVVVDLDVDTLYHVGARRLDDDEPTFHLFGADAREGCNVSPNAGTWLMGKPLAAPFRVLPYLESIDERGRGSLRFTTLDCRVQDLVIELRSLTFGVGHFVYRFDHLQELSGRLADKVIEQRQSVPARQ